MGTPRSLVAGMALVGVGLALLSGFHKLDKPNALHQSPRIQPPMFRSVIPSDERNGSTAASTVKPTLSLERKRNKTRPVVWVKISSSANTIKVTPGIANIKEVSVEAKTTGKYSQEDSGNSREKSSERKVTNHVISTNHEHGEVNIDHVAGISGNTRRLESKSSGLKSESDSEVFRVLPRYVDSRNLDPPRTLENRCPRNVKIAVLGDSTGWRTAFHLVELLGFSKLIAWEKIRVDHHIPNVNYYSLKGRIRDVTVSRRSCSGCFSFVYNCSLPNVTMEYYTLESIFDVSVHRSNKSRNNRDYLLKTWWKYTGHPDVIFHQATTTHDLSGGSTREFTAAYRRFLRRMRKYTLQHNSVYFWSPAPKVAQKLVPDKFKDATTNQKIKRLNDIVKELLFKSMAPRRNKLKSTDSIQSKEQYEGQKTSKNSNLFQEKRRPKKVYKHSGFKGKANMHFLTESNPAGVAILSEMNKDKFLGLGANLPGVERTSESKIFALPRTNTYDSAEGSETKARKSNHLEDGLNSVLNQQTKHLKKPRQDTRPRILLGVDLFALSRTLGEDAYTDAVHQRIPWYRFVAYSLLQRYCDWKHQE